MADTPSGERSTTPGAIPVVHPGSTISPSSTSTSPASSAVPAPGRREAFFDNAKYLAIVLVAVAHSWEPVMDGSRATKALYLVVYAFHMPAFIIISGYFSRSFTGRPHQVRRLVTGVAVPYIVFETGYALLRWVGEKPHHLSVTLMDPWFLTWFLVALFIWRLTTPLWRSTRHPLAIALVVAAFASLCPSIHADLDMQRVLQFLPYFVLGLCLRPEHFARVRHVAIRWMSVPVFLGAVVLAYVIAPGFAPEWLYHSRSAQQLDHAWWTGPLMQLVLICCSLVLTICFLAWVPERRTWFTVLGSGTLCGYLAHGLLIKGALFAGVFDTYPWLSRPTGEVALSLAVAVAVTLLCTPPVRRALRCVLEPDMGWVFRRDADGAAKKA